MIFTLLVLGFAALWAIVTKYKRSKHHLPPGPKSWPIIGNILDMPDVRPWETYHKWCQLYDSDIIHLQLPRTSVVVLGSVTAAVDLLEKRSQTYSDRMKSVVADLAGYGYSILTMPYGPHWRAHRKQYHQYFQQSAVGAYMPVQLRHARNFLSRTMDSPEKTRENVRLMVTASIVEVVYGKTVRSMDDKYVVVADQGVEGFSKCILPGVYLVEYLPFLRHIPSWVPFTTARRIAEKYSPYSLAARDQPYAEVQAAFNAGIPRTSIASSMCEEVQSKYDGTAEEAYHHEVARNVAVLSYAAGTDTSTSTAEALLLAMALFPEVQKAAQAEMDRVVGPNRLPEFEDIPNLPYLRAVVMETFRWMPVVPFGVPHAATANDSYKGFHIEAGTMIVPNIWAMMRNPEDYPDPERFKPERFIDQNGDVDPNIRDPSMLVFGFGRRICPGKLFGINSVTIFAASALHVFDITSGVDAFGNPLELSSEMIGAMLTKPRDVPCGLKPRSEWAARLIRDVQLE